MEITLELIREIDDITPLALEHHEQIFAVLEELRKADADTEATGRTGHIFHNTGWKGNRLHMRWCLFSEIDRRIRKGIVITQEMVDTIAYDVWEDFNND